MVRNCWFEIGCSCFHIAILASLFSPAFARGRPFLQKIVIDSVDEINDKIAAWKLINQLINFSPNKVLTCSSWHGCSGLLRRKGFSRSHRLHHGIVLNSKGCHTVQLQRADCKKVVRCELYRTPVNCAYRAKEVSVVNSVDDHCWLCINKGSILDWNSIRLLWDLTSNLSLKESEYVIYHQTAIKLTHPLTIFTALSKTNSHQAYPADSIHCAVSKQTNIGQAYPANCIQWAVSKQTTSGQAYPTDCIQCAVSKQTNKRRSNLPH